MSIEIILAAVGTIIALLAAVFVKGGSRARRKAREKELRDYEETRRRIDEEADLGVGATDDARRRRLRDFAER